MPNDEDPKKEPMPAFGVRPPQSKADRDAGIPPKGYETTAPAFAKGGDNTPKKKDEILKEADKE